MEIKYKIQLCDFYIKGKCNKQNECTYAHGEEELTCAFDEECLNEKCNRKHIIRDNIYIKDKEDKIGEKEFPILNTKKDITKNISYNLKKILNVKDEYKNDLSKFIVIEENINQNTNNLIMSTIDEMYNKLLNLKMNVKQKIKNDIKDDYLKNILINDLNNIESKIKLFKNNYKDLL